MQKKVKQKLSTDNNSKISKIIGPKCSVMASAYAKIFAKDLNAKEWTNTGL